MQRYQPIVGGTCRKASTVEPVLDKYTGEPIAEVELANPDMVDEALETGYQARRQMAVLPAHKRCDIIRKAREILKERRDHLALIIAREAGKPMKYAAGEVDRCLENLDFAAGEALRIHGETLPVDASTAGEGRSGYFARYPIGVVAAISPFNFPLNLAAHKIAPSIAAGCPVILKPAGLTPLSGIELVQAFVEAGVPEGAISVLPGPGSTVGNMMITDPRVAKVSFTGSREVGTHIIRTAGLKKVTMELGSNSGVLIDGDTTRLDQAVSRCVTGAYYNQGQVCISVQRVFVHKDCYAEFLDKFVTGTRRLVVGDPRHMETDVGPMISEAEAIRAEEWIREAHEQGAKIALGGEREGNIIRPAVITDASPDMRVMKDELFAPAVVIHPVNSFDEGIRMLDDSDYGLQAGIYTDHVDRALTAADAINVGGVMINDIPAFRVDHMPYGGNKGSGLGREGARFAIEDMTTLRMVVFNRS